ncbi:MAG: FAD-binding oxidoreductase [Comamonadaceae bacterium]|nr:MAG: FAD-binding oxidoreductase [Comamonadaceae bacterium]
MTHTAYDVAIIGGGIHGCSTAYHLARRGVRVIILEADYCARHASGVNAGGVRTLGRKLEEIPLSLASCDMWHELSHTLGQNAAFYTGGQIKVAESEADVAILQARVDTLQAQGFTHEKMIDAQTTRELLPAIAPHVAGAIWVERDGYAIPYKSVTAFRRAACALGAVVRENCRVSSIEQRGSQWHLNTPTGTVGAEQLVITAGAWSGPLARQLGETLPVEPGGLMLMVTQRLPHFVDPVVGAASRGLSFKQYDNGTVVIGGELHCDVDIEAAHAELDFSRLAVSARIVTDLFPHLKNVSLNRAWSGVEGFTPDKLPIIGHSVNIPKLVYACGFSASGFQLGPASGRAVSELVLDGSSKVPIDGLSPARFQTSHAMSARAA